MGWNYQEKRQRFSEALRWGSVRGCAGGRRTFMCIKTELSRGRAALGTEQRRPAQLGALAGLGVVNISHKGWVWMKARAQHL